jgi:lysophospholipase L1-like esterase
MSSFIESIVFGIKSKVGMDTLNTTAQNCIEAINEVKIKADNAATQTDFNAHLSDYTTHIQQEFNTNLLNVSAITTGYYLNELGVPTAIATFGYSDYIPVQEGELYCWYNLDNNNIGANFSGAFYVNNKIFISYIQSNRSVDVCYSVVPANVCYIRINIGTSHYTDAYFKKISKPKWFGKNLALLGDSIANGSSLDIPTNQNFGTLVKNRLGLANSFNYGVGSSKITNVTTDTVDSFTDRYSAMDSSADIVIVLGGTNDYGHTTSNTGNYAPFGTFADRADNTFYGALHVLCKGLVEKYPGKAIVFLAPIHRNAPAGVSGDDYVTNPDTGKNLKDYVNAIREVTEYYGITVLDLFKTLNNLNPNISTLKTTYMPDGLHPNFAGHQIIANAICSYLEKL